MPERRVRSIGSSKKYSYTTLSSSALLLTDKHSDSSSQSDSDDALELRAARKPPKPAAPIDIVERRLEEGDTLQKISLQYGIPISELKRTNNLMSDQDFFALKILKIPVKKYSHLEEVLSSSDLASQSLLASNEDWEPIELSCAQPHHSVDIDLGSVRQQTSGFASATQSDLLGCELNELPDGEVHSTFKVKDFLQTVDKNVEMVKNSLNGNSPDRISSSSIGRTIPSGVDVNSDDEGRMRNVPAFRMESHWNSNLRHFVIVIACIALLVGGVLGVLIYLTNPHLS